MQGAAGQQGYSSVRGPRASKGGVRVCRVRTVGWSQIFAQCASLRCIRTTGHECFVHTLHISISTSCWHRKPRLMYAQRHALLSTATDQTDMFASACDTTMEGVDDTAGMDGTAMDCIDGNSVWQHLLTCFDSGCPDPLCKGGKAVLKHRLSCQVRPCGFITVHTAHLLC